MASDYKAIRERDLVQQIKRAVDVLANLYDEGAHFILELLQNAEDALRRRDCESDAPRAVRFDLAAHELRVSHYGRPFDEDDVKGICAIGEGTKEEDITQIGRFGIGFKSVYRFTDRPQIHSGAEHFVIEDYVRPSATQPIQDLDPAETVLVMPLSNPDGHHSEIADGLRDIGLDTLLFLREIDTIKWSIAPAETGMYTRRTKRLAEYVRRVTLIGESNGHAADDEDWLVFSKPMHGNGGEPAGYVEAAFSVKDNDVSPVSLSRLVVFFPTAVPTNLGLCVQGPYRTTPSRDNVPKGDPWNEACVENTGELLVDALLWLRDNGRLTTNVLRCLPLDEAKFSHDSMLAPLYDKIKAAFMRRRLLPVYGGGFAAAGEVKIATSGDLRDLFTPAMLGEVLEDEPLYWLSGEITNDSEPELTRYLRKVLDVGELRPLNVIRRLSPTFLERQSNDWVRELYEFMNVQGDLHREARQEWPLVRLSDGRHVVAYKNDMAQAHFPGKEKTDFPTIHSEVCSTDEAREFLEAIGLSIPNPVDDVIRNVLPKYKRGEVDVDEEHYAEDIQRIVNAFHTDSTERRGKLVDSLKKTHFVCAIDTEGRSSWSKPSEVYVGNRLTTLFDGVNGVLFLDHRNYRCMLEEEVRDRLVECGASRVLQMESIKCTRSDREMREILRGQGLDFGYPRSPSDCSLRGVEQLLAYMVDLPAEERRLRAGTLWDALVDVARHTRSAFDATCEWSYSHQSKTVRFDSTLVKTLNELAWVPSGDGHFRVPSEVSFQTLKWRSDQFLESRIRFKPDAVDRLAEEVGVEPDVLYLLKEHGLTNMDAIRDRLGLAPEVEGDETAGENTVEDAVAALGVGIPSPPPAGGNAIENDTTHSHGAGVQGERSTDWKEGNAGLATTAGTPAPREAFHSYLAVHPKHASDGSGSGLRHEISMALEEAAIESILDHEPDWQRTPQHNEGFDLVQFADGRACAWCEVKAMKGNLDDRPVTMSHAQFKCAQEHGDAYWLYIVQQAGSDAARIVRIRDPAGKAKSFTFDKGWLHVAEEVD